ncbi:MAG TPA: carbohydrate porin [Acetobacteraceae bacterium]|nr:carbohydrate porin [Acetobacteraceae bacterium]
MDYAKSLFWAACLLGAATGIDRAALADSLSATAPASIAPGPNLPVQSQAATGGSAPIILRLQYSGEAADNAIGGLHNGATYMNNILGQLTVNTDSAFGWPGGKFVLQAFYQNADSLDTQYVGALQDPSLIDTSGVAMYRLYQAYYQQILGNTDLLFGIYDLETEFGITRPMDIFFNGAYAWTTTLDQSGVNGPSTYPSTSLAFRVRQQIADHWSVQAAVLDGVPDSVKYPNINAVNINRTAGALLIAEADYTPTRTTKLMAGYWDYTGKFEELGEPGPDGIQRYVFGSSGGYIGGATRLYSQTARRGLDVFANLGIATAQTQQADRSLNLGVTYTGLLDARPIDRFGFAVGIAHAGSPYRQMQIASGSGVEVYETNFELTYRAPITRWLVVQPDIQYWINPNMDPTLKNDLLFMLHFEISHVFD